MRNSKILMKIIKDNHMTSFIVTYLVLILLSAFVLAEVEPEMSNVGDALWYIFALITSTGFGDITSVSILGRVISVILGIYSIFVIALLTALVINFYQEKMKIQQNESVMLFLDKMERLPELSKEELEAMSAKVKAFKRK